MKTSTAAISTEIYQLWRHHFGRHVELPTNGRLRPLAAIRAKDHQLSDEELASSGELLQPGLAIFEFGLDWLTQVQIAIKESAKDCGEKELSEVTWALLGAACSFGWTLRNACVGGFDVPGRALLRTYVESILASVVALYDVQFCQAYFDASGDQEVRDFWHKYASPKRLHQKVMAIEASLGFDEETIEGMSEYRRQEYEVLSQCSHLSFFAASAANAPRGYDEESEENFKSAITEAGSKSGRAIKYAVMTTYYFGMVAIHRITGEKGKLFTFDRSNITHLAVFAGREVLLEVTKKHFDKDESGQR